MMSLARRSFRRRSMNMWTMNMAVWCPRLNMYLLLPLQWLTAPLLHLRRRIKIEENLQVRGASIKARTSPARYSGWRGGVLSLHVP
jgi:hypothetical protein